MQKKVTTAPPAVPAPAKSTYFMTDTITAPPASLLETARPILEALIQDVTGTKVLSLHHDASTVTGEEVVLFTLAESPLYRQARKT